MINLFIWQVSVLAVFPVICLLFCSVGAVMASLRGDKFNVRDTGFLIFFLLLSTLPIGLTYYTGSKIPLQIANVFFLFPLFYISLDEKEGSKQTAAIVSLLFVLAAVIFSLF